MATPNDTTDNHGFQLWGDGQTNWEHRTDFRALDALVEIRDADAARSEYDPKAGALFRATDTGDVYLGDGETWTLHNPAGGGDGGTTGPWAVPSGRTVADIADAVANNDVVCLEPGVTYTNNGSTITFPDDREVTVIAYGATIQVRSNPTVFIPEASVSGGWSRWLGGQFEGSQSSGEIGFQVEDGIRNILYPTHGRDMECFIALTNDDLWCEHTKIRSFGRDNECDIMLVGANGSPPSGTTVRRTNGGAGSSQSYRFLQIEYNSSVRDNQPTLDRGYGLYMDDASPYTGFINLSVSIGPGITGFRYHGRMNGNNVWYHCESPKGQGDGGIGFQCDKNLRGPALMRARIGGGVGQTFINNTDEPIVYFDTAQNPSQEYWRLMRDGDPMISFADENGEHVMRMPGIDRIRLGGGRELS